MATLHRAVQAPRHLDHVLLALATSMLLALLVGIVGGLGGATTGHFPTQPGGPPPVHQAPVSPRPSPSPGPAPGI